MTYLFIAVAITIAIQGYLLFTRKHVWFELKDETKAAWRDAKAELRQKKWEERNPVGEPLCEADIDGLLAAYRAFARPVLLLRPDAAAPPAEAPTRLGGPAWLAEGEEWPLDANGDRLEFVAQVDFGRLPRLDGFPERGVARFFVGRDDLWGADWDQPDRSAVRVLWRDGEMESGQLVAPAPLLEEDYSPFQDTAVRDEGLALNAERVTDIPDFDSWQVQQLTEGLQRRPGIDEAEDRLLALAETRELAHRIGGHPSFTQPDFRSPGKFGEFDVLLFGLTSDDAVMWGDLGEAMFLIRREDLARRDFSRVAFYWDCH